MSIINDALQKDPNFENSKPENQEKSSNTTPNPEPTAQNTEPPVKKNLATIEKEELAKKATTVASEAQRFSKPVVLKQAQERVNQNQTVTQEPTKGPSFNRKFAFVMIVCLTALAALVYFTYPILSKKFAAKQVFLSKGLKHSAPGKKVPHGTLILEGIVQIDKQPFALINNEIYEEGSEIGGRKILKILPQEVHVEDRGKVKILKIYPK